MVKKWLKYCSEQLLPVPLLCTTPPPSLYFVQFFYYENERDRVLTMASSCVLFVLPLAQCERHIGGSGGLHRSHKVEIGLGMSRSSIMGLQKQKVSKVREKVSCRIWKRPRAHDRT